MTRGINSNDLNGREEGGCKYTIAIHILLDNNLVLVGYIYQLINTVPFLPPFFMSLFFG